MIVFIGFLRFASKRKVIQKFLKLQFVAPIYFMLGCECGSLEPRKPQPAARIFTTIIAGKTCHGKLRLQKKPREPKPPPDIILCTRFVAARIFYYLCSAFAGCSAVRLAHLLWEQGVAGSNPVSPTSEVIVYHSAGEHGSKSVKPLVFPHFLLKIRQAFLGF